MADRDGSFAIVQRIVRAIAIALGAVCTLVSFASIVGIVTGNGWARLLVALLFTVGVPLAVVDRALPKKDADKTPLSRVADVAAVVLLSVSLAFIGFGEPITRPLLVREGDRLAESGYGVPAHAVYLLAGVRPVDPPSSPATPPAPSAPVAPPSSASGGPR
jgi:hypothetical protein